jgi:hypothetical protein
MTMNETICNIMLFGGIALAVIFAILAVILFIKLDIPKVIGDLTGMTAKKQIQEIREKGYESVQGAGASKKEAIKSKDSQGRIEVRDVKRSSTVNKASSDILRKSNEKYKNAIKDLERTRTSDTSKNIRTPEEDYEMATDILQEETDYEGATDILENTDLAEEATDVLSNTEYDEEATDILSGSEYDEEATDILSGPEYDEEATDILSSGYSEGVTNASDKAEGEEAAYAAGTRKSSLVKLVDIVVVHTDESI